MTSYVTVLTLSALALSLLAAFAWAWACWACFACFLALPFKRCGLTGAVELAAVGESLSPGFGTGTGAGASSETFLAWFL